MGMALRCDVVDACRAAGTEKPIDLAFLSAQTMGDANLEMDILNLFVAQAAEFSSSIEKADNPDDICRTAHTLKGAARSIGAFRLAELASDAEKKGKFEIGAIKKELTSVCQYISSLQQSN